MEGKGITSISEWEDKLIKMEPWALMAEDISDTFRRWELVWDKFINSISDLIKLWKDDDVMKLVKRYYEHHWHWKYWNEIFKKLVDLWYLDISKWKDHKYFAEPQLLEAAVNYLDEHPDKADKIKEIFGIK